jgi:DNA-binding IclR family transcriptional regulator
MSDNKQTAATSYLCEAQQRLLFVQSALIGREIEGASLTEIANAWADRNGKTKTGQKNNIFRDLQNLRLAGYAEQLPDSERWRLGPKLVQAAFQVQRHFQRMQERLGEFEQRYTRTPT